MTEHLRLYDYAASGNCYKVRLLLAQLERRYERIAIDIFDGDTLTDEFAQINPLRSTPVLQIGDTRYLIESNAILAYLAEGTVFMPRDPADRAGIVRWLIYEQTDVMPAIGGLRFRLLTGRFSSTDAEGAPAPSERRSRAPDPRGRTRAKRLPGCRALFNRRHSSFRLHPRRARGRLRPATMARRAELDRACLGPTALPERSRPRTRPTHDLEQAARSTVDTAASIAHLAPSPTHLGLRTRPGDPPLLALLSPLSTQASPARLPG